MRRRCTPNTISMEKWCCALTPIFLDERMSAERSPAALKLIERLARKAISLAGVPDAGIWEFRTDWKPQTFSSLMCWAAADRMARIATRHDPALVAEFHAAAGRIREEVLTHSWSAEKRASSVTMAEGPGRFTIADRPFTISCRRKIRG